MDQDSGMAAADAASKDRAGTYAEREGETFVDRLEAERAELNARATKLSDFIHCSPAFQSISPTQHNLLLIQMDAMHVYLKTLSARLSDLRNVPPATT